MALFGLKLRPVIAFVYDYPEWDHQTVSDGIFFGDLDR